MTEVTFHTREKVDREILVINWPPLLKPERRPNISIITTLKENNTGKSNIKMWKETEKGMPGTY